MLKFLGKLFSGRRDGEGGKISFKDRARTPEMDKSGGVSTQLDGERSNETEQALRHPMVQGKGGRG